MSGHRWSRACYRALLRIYPLEFRQRFASDLENDFAELLNRDGRRAAWTRVIVDLMRSIPMTHGREQRERQRVFGLTLGGETVMGTLGFDLRHAVRSLVKTPVFTTVTLVTLALGIGAGSAVFSLVNAVLLRPSGYRDAERLMAIHEIVPASQIPRFGVSPSDYLDLEQYQQSFDSIGIYRTRLVELSGAGSPEQVMVAQVSPSIFPILGVNPAEGRAFLPEEGQAQVLVAVVTDTFARLQLGGQPAIGARLTLDRRPYTIVGVMPPGFEFPKRGSDRNPGPADVYVPLVFTAFERQARRIFYHHSVLGRLKPGVTPEQAAADTAALAPRVLEHYPAIARSPGSLRISATPWLEDLSGPVRRPLLILLAAVGLVLLVVCANVGNLMLSRAVTRQREFGVRIALGAARHRLFQMLLLESLLLAFGAGLMGLVLGQWTLRAMPAALASGLPGVAALSLDVRVAAFTFLLCLVTALFFGLVPLAGGQHDLNGMLREGGARAIGGRGHHRLQSALVVASVAFAFVLLAGAGLLIRSFTNLMAVDAGTQSLNVLTLEVTLPHASYNQAPRIRTFYQTLLDRLRAIPGVRSAAIATDLPVKTDGERRSFTPSGLSADSPQPPSVAVTWIHGDYFATYGVPLIRGRSFTPEEQVENRQVAIVSRGLADKFWPGQDAIGKQIRWGGPDVQPPLPPWQTVVGVAGDVVDGPLGREPVIHIYVPYSETADMAIAAPVMTQWRQMKVALNTDRSPEFLTSSARAAVASLDSALAVANVQTMRQVLSDASAPQRFSTTLLTGFAGGALLLAGIGLYGVLAFGVSQRTREIGVRLALGAARGEVIGLVVRQGMTLAAIGLAIGCLAALATTRLLRSLLFETNVYDPWTFAAVPVVLALAALAACALPARRAARVDPMVALRSE